MIFRNKTHYFQEYTRIFNAFPDPDSFSCQSSKRMGYFQRLWFEYAYTRKVRGMCFFYTLTYNDSHIPKFLGKNCFSYKDIRYVTNGKLSKVLLRSYGSRLRYFCACETGEGKGTRGLGNNPHYHFIFFVQPVHDEDGKPVYDNYKPITTNEFKDLIYELWQGKPSDCFIPWQLAKYGHAQEGKYNGEVLTSDVFSYVGKYVVKDLDERNFEEYLERYFYNEIKSRDIDNTVLYEYYKYLKVYDFSAELDKYKFFDYLHLFDYSRWRRSTGYVDKSLERFLLDYCGADGQMLIFQLTSWFYDEYIPKYLSDKLSDYKNNYSGKCRMSKTLGEYGLNFIMEVHGSPRVVLNTNSGYEVQYPCLYYIRKLYYDVKICPVTGNPLYFLNEKGIQMKIDTLKRNIQNYTNLVNECIAYKQTDGLVISLSDSDKEYCYLLDSIVNGEKYEFKYKDEVVFDSFVSSPVKDDIIHRYCVYHFIYQYRNSYDFSRFKLTSDCLESDYLEDYNLFLHTNSHFLDYDSCTVYDMVFKSISLGFSSHPAFLEYKKYFQYLDKLIDVVTHLRSESRKSEFADKFAHQSRISAYKFNCAVPYGKF